jgi:phosphatidylglycerophosphatase A
MNEPCRPDLRFLLSSPAVFLALGGGAGLVPKAPGTAGSLLAIPLALLLQTQPFVWQILIWAALYALGIWLCDVTGRALGEADHPAIVWDEICGQTMVLLVGPPGAVGIVAGFVVFRFFDISKPWPIHVIDRHFRNGLGCMGDDLVAALYAVAVVWIASIG